MERKMKLLFKQRIFSWIDSYDIYDEKGNTVYIVKGQISFGHRLKIYDAPKYDIDFNGWHVEGNYMEWDYTITDRNGGTVATVSKELFKLSDTYVLDIVNPQDALHVLMFVLAIDAEKCSRN